MTDTGLLTLECPGTAATRSRVEESREGGTEEPGLLGAENIQALGPLPAAGSEMEV